MPPPRTSLGAGLGDTNRDALPAAAYAASAARRSSTTNEPGVDAELQSPSVLRNLVLNYLVHHCYIDTAIVFAQDGIGGGGAAANASVNITKGEGSSNGASTRSGGASWTGKKSANGYHLNGKPSMNNGNAESSGARRTGAANGGSTHPLAAPPLSREDSVMEIEAETVAASIDPARTEMAERGTTVPGYGGASAMYGEAANGGAAGDEDTAMDDDGKRARLSSSAKGKSAETRQLVVGEADLTQEDVMSVLLRREVRDHILAGRIRQAVESCNTHFPGVLSTPSDSKSRRGPDDSQMHATAASPAEPVAPTGKRRGHSGKGSSLSYQRLLPANPTSLDPAHLSLNLQIQEFIESVRAANSAQQASAAIPNTSNGVAAPTASASSPSSEQPPAGNSTTQQMSLFGPNTGISRAASPAPSSTSSVGSAASAAGGAASSAVYHAALSYIQTLHATCMELTNLKSRAMYMKEIESVSVLLAYRDLEKSPVRKYLDQRRRIALAEQINSAIIYQSGQPSQPLIESAARQTTFVWNQIFQDRFALPSNEAFLSANGFRTHETLLEGESTAKGAQPQQRLAAAWDLRGFLMDR